MGLALRVLVLTRAVDRLDADQGAALFQPQPARHLLGRPALGQAAQHLVSQALVAVQLTARPTPHRRLRLGVAGLIRSCTGASPGVALQLATDARRLAIQSCSDLADRRPLGL